MSKAATPKPFDPRSMTLEEREQAFRNAAKLEQELAKIGKATKKATTRK